MRRRIRRQREARVVRALASGALETLAVGGGRLPPTEHALRQREARVVRALESGALETLAVGGGRLQPTEHALRQRERALSAAACRRRRPAFPARAPLASARTTRASRWRKACSFLISVGVSPVMRAPSVRLGPAEVAAAVVPGVAAVPWRLRYRAAASFSSISSLRARAASAPGRRRSTARTKIRRGVWKLSYLGTAWEVVVLEVGPVDARDVHVCGKLALVHVVDERLRTHGRHHALASQPKVVFQHGATAHGWFATDAHHGLLAHHHRNLQLGTPHSAYGSAGWRALWRPSAQGVSG